MAYSAVDPSPACEAGATPRGLPLDLSRFLSVERYLCMPPRSGFGERYLCMPLGLDSAGGKNPPRSTPFLGGDAGPGACVEPTGFSGLCSV